MKKKLQHVLLALAVFVLVACGTSSHSSDEGAGLSNSEQTTESQTEQAESSEEAAEEAEGENTTNGAPGEEEAATETGSGNEETGEEHAAGLDEYQPATDRIMTYLTKEMGGEIENPTVIVTERDDYVILEVRSPNPNDPAVTQMLGIFRYFPDTEVLELMNVSTGDYHEIP